ncbi:MAG: amidase [Acidobacteria bacterium]|nr:MAG: amidase [Acidobacteriota bacterium]
MKPLFRYALGLTMLAMALVAVRAAHAFSYVGAPNGTFWGIQDAAPPGVDTGSIWGTQTGEGARAPFTTTINGYGGLRVRIDSSPAPRFNGQMLRGFGLQFDGHEHSVSTRAVALGPANITRSIWINRQANWGRWLDTFTNTSARPLTLDAAFGGQTGIGASGPYSSYLVRTSSGGTRVSPHDVWIAYATPAAKQASRLVGGTQITVTGRFFFAGDWLNDPFRDSLRYRGYRRNFPAFVNTLHIPADQSRSLLHFVVLGPRVNAQTSAAAQARAEAMAGQLAAHPNLAGLTPAEICSVANFTLTCPATAARRVPQPPPPAPLPTTTSVAYNVVGKTIDQLQAAMESGETTSQAITQAYLNRIAAYDRGQFGFHAFEIVAGNALAQAKATDVARRAGRRGRLLGIPVAIKNLYDTFDMPTTNGSLTFAGFRPAHDAFQVARLRSAGAVIIGKAAMEEYATNGFYSNDAWGQVWNVFSPSRSALGSSGGSAVAVAASFAAAALGTQTGDSLYAPASAAGLVTLRPTDGMESSSGIMPLVWMTDTGGVLARSVPDLTDMLNVVTGTDANDPATAEANKHRPHNWRSVLDPNALRGKRIGIIASAWRDPFGTHETLDAEKAALRFFTAAGATLVPMGATVGGPDRPPHPRDTAGGNLEAEGWMRYLDRHPELLAQGFPLHNFVQVECSQKMIAYSRLPLSACAEPEPPRMSAAQIAAHRAYRHLRQAGVRAWLNAAGADHRGVDAVVYPGLLSEISLNDGGGERPSFGRRDTPSAANGVPTVVFPAGRDILGNPVDIELLGRARDDAKLVGMAYAFELLANRAGDGHVSPSAVPPLRYVGRKR